MPEYPTLRIDALSLRNRFAAIRQQTKHQSVKSRYGELARIAYYLRDPKAPYYLQKAAESKVWHASRLNFYRMAGNWASMQTIYAQLLQQAATAEHKQHDRYQREIFEALFWLGNDRECSNAYQQQDAVQNIRLADIISQLAEARLTGNSQQALAIAKGLASTIRDQRLEPWSDLSFNHWDLYEIACQQLDPPLAIYGPITTPSDDPDLRLLALLNEQQIIALEWSIYNNQDQTDEGFCSYILADSSRRRFAQGIDNPELERLVWDLFNDDWPYVMPPRHLSVYGIYRLEVAEAAVYHVGDLWSYYDYVEIQTWGELDFEATPHPDNPDVYAYYYFPYQQRPKVLLEDWAQTQRDLYRFL